MNETIAEDRDHRPRTRVLSKPRCQEIRKNASRITPRRPRTVALDPKRTQASSTHSKESENNGLFDTKEAIG